MLANLELVFDEERQQQVAPGGGSGAAPPPWAVPARLRLSRRGRRAAPRPPMPSRLLQHCTGSRRQQRRRQPSTIQGRWREGTLRGAAAARLQQ